MCHAVGTADKHYYIRKRLESAPEAANIVRSVFYGEKEMGLSSTFLRSETEQNTPIEAIDLIPARGMLCIPGGGNTHGLSTPKRKYTEQEKTRIHYAVPKNATLRDLSVGTSYKKIVDRIKC